MPKRAGLIRMAKGPHVLGGAGSSGERGRKSAKIKKKSKVNVKPSTTAKTAAVAASVEADDMFAMALPTKLSVRASKKQRRAELAAEPVEHVPAFEDAQKQDMFAQGVLCAPVSFCYPYPSSPLLEPFHQFHKLLPHLSFRPFSVLAAAKRAPASNMIPIDEHRARMIELKRQKADRMAMKAQRFAAHQKC